MKELIVFFTSASPLVELRGAIPLAILVYKFPLIKSFIIAILGNILPILPILYFLEGISNFLRKRFLFFEKFFSWLFQRTRKKFQDSYLKWGKVALVIFVAIPLPFTGAWTGSLAAFLFGFKKKEAFWLITLGVLIAAIIVSFLTVVGEKLV